VQDDKEKQARHRMADLIVVVSIAFSQVRMTGRRLRGTINRDPDSFRNDQEERSLICLCGERKDP
jgi:hypothetical protein